MDRVKPSLAVKLIRKNRWELKNNTPHNILIFSAF